MEISSSGKSPNTSLSFRYNANNEELEELYHNVCEDDPPTPQCDPPSTQIENASPKRGDKTPSIIDKYFKSIRSEKMDDVKPVESKVSDESKTPITPKEVTASPMKEYLNRLGKRSTSEVTPESREGGNETWKIFHDFKFKIAQAVEDMKTRSTEETKEKSVPRENSTSDSEENSAVKDADQQSVGDTDNQVDKQEKAVVSDSNIDIHRQHIDALSIVMEPQVNLVSSLDSSIQNLSDMTQPLTAKATERELSLPVDNKSHSDSSDDTHKNLAQNDSEDVTRDILTDSNMMEVESGIEALEDGIDGFGDIPNSIEKSLPSDNPMENIPNQPPTPSNLGLSQSKNSLQKIKETEPKSYFLNFTMYFLTFIVLVNYILFPYSNIWNGFLLGIWFFCFASNFKHWVLDNFLSEGDPRKGSYFHLKRSSAIPAAYTIPSVKEHRPMKKYEGWINHYRFPEYDPSTYHINKTTTAFIKLEGCNLRISYTKTKIAKRALWDEKIEKVMFYQHRLYNLTGARIILLPKGLVKRRQWSKKYPICIILSEKEKIQVLERESIAAETRASEAVTSEKKKDQHQQDFESTETNTSPEKKKKFVWRRREKSVTHAEVETGKEGLRHRLARKMHRDKKVDNVSSSNDSGENPTQVPQDKSIHIEESLAEPEVDLETKSATSTKDDVEEEFDETELSKIKEFLEETELEPSAEGTAEGEWSVHVKQSKDKHSHLYLFTRTGRDKHEWFRRISNAISEANAALAETSATEEKSAAEAPTENQDGIELAVYKLSEKDTVAFAKTSNKSTDSTSEGVTITSLSQPMPFDAETYEKNFWPYLIKIIQTHKKSCKQSSEAGVMCQIQPTQQEKAKSKKKKVDTKSPSPDCPCRMLPSEIAWLNTIVARVIYDVMRDPIIIKRVQNKIQRKLHTMKLPSFMSPLVVTELSLAGACPMVERVLSPTWDERGVWIDADLRYDGGAYIAILTQINLMKLKEKNTSLEEELNENLVESDTNVTPSGGVFSEKQLRKKKPAIYDSDEEDSAESSSDDESPPLQPVDSAEHVPPPDAASTTTEGGSSKKKFLRIVDKIATNKYFQQVTDYKYVKRAMEGLSNTDIKLHLEIHGLEGRLALNLPAPPHDRLWIGFRTNPQLVLKARPAVGARTLRFTHISNWIEQKLSKEFEKVLVLPNMEDLIIDVMSPTPVDFE